MVAERIVVVGGIAEIPNSVNIQFCHHMAYDSA